MSRTNTFVAYAYLKSSDRPYSVICNYIAYAIKSYKTEEVSAEQIISKVESEFGAQLSPLLLQACLRLLIKEKRVAVSRMTGGIALLNIGFNVEKFEKDRDLLNQQEQRIIAGLIDFTSHLGVTPAWTEMQSRENLSKFLLKDDLGLNLALTGDIKLGKSTKLSADWYIGRYISKLTKESEEYNYLLKISYGMMVYVGITETSSDHQELSQKFKGTDFYLDTKIILRAMGLSLPFYVQTAKDLIDLIKKHNKGNVVVFEHTVDEVLTALNNASRELKSSKRVNDEELNLYRIYYNCDEDDFQQLHDSAREKIEKIMGIEIKPACLDWNNEVVQVNNLDWGGLLDKISKDHPKWKEQAIKNDVTSINTINILRQGDYSQRFGGTNKLPVFVTTNTALVASIREFVADQFDAKESANGSNWTKTRLPIISEGTLICRLWTPQSKRFADMPINILAANAFAAQQEEVEFYDKIRSECAKARVIFENSPLDVGKLRDRKFEEELVKQSHGDIEKIDETLISLSLEELVKTATINETQEIERLLKENEFTNQDKLDQIGAWFNAYCQMFTKKSYCRGTRLLALINKWIWPYVFLITFVGIGETAIAIIAHDTKLSSTYYSVPIIIGIILALIDRFINDCGFTKGIKQNINKKLKEKYLNHIRKDIPEGTIVPKEDIIRFCSENVSDFD